MNCKFNIDMEGNAEPSDLVFSEPDQMDLENSSFIIEGEPIENIGG